MERIKKFIYVGIIATLVDYVVYSLLVYNEIVSYTVAIIFGYSIGFVISFFFTRNYVFSKIKINNIHHEFFIILLISIVGLLINIGIVYILISSNINSYIARAIAILIVFFFNYFTRKGFIYA